MTAVARRRLVIAALLALLAMWEVTDYGPNLCDPAEHSATTARP